MKSFLVRGICTLAMITCVVLSLGAQGLYWESTTTAMGMEQSGKTYYMPKMFKNVGSNGSFIFRLDRQMLYEIHPEKKTYSEITFAELEAAMKNLTGQMDKAMADMKKQMESMPAEQRKMMEQMMGSKMLGTAQAGEMQVTNTGKSQTISGFHCTSYVIKNGENDIATIWATREVSGFAAMRNDFAEFTKRLAFNAMAGAMAKAMEKVDGFPIQTETSQGMKQVVTKVEKRSIAAGEFEVPAGYTKVESQLLKGK